MNSKVKIAKITGLKKVIRVRESRPRLTYNRMKKMDNDDWRIHVISDTLQKSVCDYLLQNSLYSDIKIIKYLDGDMNVFEATPELIIATVKNSNFSPTDYLIFHKRKNRKKWALWQKK